MSDQRKKPASKGKKPVKNTSSNKKSVREDKKTPKQARDRPNEDIKPAKPKEVAKKQDKNNKKDNKKDKKKILLYIIIAILIVIIALLLLKACNSKDKKSEYEDSVSMSYEPNADIQVDDSVLNLAVLPDYMVTKSKPEMLIPYPEQNSYDIDLTFRKADTNEVLYQSKLIAPGSIISVPAYSFCDDGTHDYRVEVTAYDRTTHEAIESSVAMQVEITKK